MLEQPRSHDVGSEFRKNAAFLLLLMTVHFRVFVGRPVAGPDAVIQTVTCSRQPANKLSQHNIPQRRFRCVFDINSLPRYAKYRVAQKQSTRCYRTRPILLPKTSPDAYRISRQDSVMLLFVVCYKSSLKISSHLKVSLHYPALHLFFRHVSLAART